MTRKIYDLMVELYFDDPIGFIENVIEYEKAPEYDDKGNVKKEGRKIKIGKQQRQVLLGAVEAIENKKGLATKSGRGTGKTCCSSWLGLWYAFTREQSCVACTAPREQQIKRGIWGEFKRWISLSPILDDFFIWGAEVIQVKSFETEGETVGGWEILATTCSSESNVSGIHGANGTLFIVDEAAGITSDNIWAGIEGSITDKGSLLAMIGNPTALYTRFYDAFHTLKEEHVTITLSAEHEDYRGDKDRILQWKRKYGENSNFYRNHVKGEFSVSDPDAFISEEELRDVFNREVSDFCYPIIAIDPSDSGDDSTEIVGGNGYKVLYWRTIHGKQDGHKIVANVTQMVYDMRCNHEQIGFQRDMVINVILDSNGIGASTRDLLKVKSRELCINIIENKSSTGGDKYYDRMKDLLWGIMKQMLPFMSLHYEANMVNYTHNQLNSLDFKNELETQICSRKYSINPTSSKVEIESKKSLKTRGLCSPDKGDAFSLYCFQLSTKVLKHSFYKNNFAEKTNAKAYSDLI